MSLSEKKRIVVKVGTSTLTHRSTGKTNLSRMAKLVSVLADLKNAGHEVVLVSSGAVGIGLAKMMIKNRPDEIRTLQAAAAVGQCELMFLYDKFFSEYSQVVAQLLCTMEDIENPQSRLHLTDSIEELLQKDIVPIINEGLTSFIVGAIFTAVCYLWIHSQNHRWESGKYRPLATKLVAEDEVEGACGA